MMRVTLISTLLPREYKVIHLKIIEHLMEHARKENSLENQNLS